MAVSAFHVLAGVQALRVHDDALVVGVFGIGILEVTIVGILGLRS